MYFEKLPASEAQPREEIDSTVTDQLMLNLLDTTSGIGGLPSVIDVPRTVQPAAQAGPIDDSFVRDRDMVVEIDDQLKQNRPATQASPEQVPTHVHIPFTTHESKQAESDSGNVSLNKYRKGEIVPTADHLVQVAVSLTQLEKDDMETKSEASVDETVDLSKTISAIDDIANGVPLTARQSIVFTRSDGKQFHRVTTPEPTQHLVVRSPTSHLMMQPGLDEPAMTQLIRTRQSAEGRALSNQDPKPSVQDCAFLDQSHARPNPSLIIKEEMDGHEIPNGGWQSEPHVAETVDPYQSEQHVPLVVASVAAQRAPMSSLVDTTNHANELAPGLTCKDAQYIELAKNDEDLFCRIKASDAIKCHDYGMPAWLATIAPKDGDPSLVNLSRREELFYGQLAGTDDELRWIRNRAVIDYITPQIQRYINYNRGAATHPPYDRVDTERITLKDIGFASKLQDALNDEQLRLAIKKLALKHDIEIPLWLDKSVPNPVNGYPSQIPDSRRIALARGESASDNIHERRFVRNLNAIHEIAEQIMEQVGKNVDQVQHFIPLKNDNRSSLMSRGFPELARRHEAAVTTPECRRLYVSNLSDVITEKDLRAFFEDFLLESLEVPINWFTKRAVGHAFVDLSTSDEAKRAIVELDGKMILERKASIMLAQKPSTDGLSTNTSKRSRKKAAQFGTLVTRDKTTSAATDPFAAPTMRPATTDEDLRRRIGQLAKLHHFNIRLPQTLNGPNISGCPDLVSETRRQALESGEAPSSIDVNESRLVRNIAAAREVESQIQKRLIKRQRRAAKKEERARAKKARACKEAQNEPEVHGASRDVKVPDNTTSVSIPTMKQQPDPLQYLQETASADTKILKSTALAPFYSRMQEDCNTISQLRAENEALRASIVESNQGMKRKVWMTPSTSGHEDEQALRTYQPLNDLVHEIRMVLGEAVPNETIHLCGLAPIQIITTRPQDVLQLAHDRLHTWKFDRVPTCWRRLFEDASLHIVTGVLEKLSQQALPPLNYAKRIKLGQEEHEFEKKIAEVAKQLDSAIIIVGAPGRRSLIEEIFRQLDTIMRFFAAQSTPQQISMVRALDLSIQGADLHSHIIRTPQTWSVDSFQVHLDSRGGPVIIPNSFLHWPAMQKWQDLSYLNRNTLGGYRTVPVEVGTSYTEDNWTQRIMTFKEFAEKFLLPDEPIELGYLAQHDLFKQIPSLMNDITIPDYCHTIPPSPQGAAAQTAGLDSVMRLEEPLVNAWLGPKGTKTPLHTDPYHNILCQVVGYKYIRLYPPTEFEKLYPEGMSEAGVNMQNTSKIDIWPFVPRRGQQAPRESELQKLREKFPRFETAEYQEAILSPGECLYVPLGYWHYVESLSTSFSVSFWWN